MRYFVAAILKISAFVPAHLLAIAAFAVVGSVAKLASAQTRAPDYPVCLHVYGPAAYYDCSYTSISQCSQSASGRPAQCVTNPYVASVGIDQTRSRARRVH